MLPELKVFFASLTPFADIKLAVPLGLSYGLSTISILIFATAGAMFPSAVALALAEKATKFFREKWKFFDTILTKVLNKTRADHSANFEKYGPLIITLVVAIPIPGSGSVTGAMIAFLFGVEYWKGLGLITLGIIISELLIIAGVESVTALFSLF
jgi:uncharacterized membrane protein